MKRILALALVLSVVLLSLASCELSDVEETLNKIFSSIIPPDQNISDSHDAWDENYDIISLSDAIELCANYSGAPSSERYYIRGTIKTITNLQYGAMVITDGTLELSVYGTYSADGEVPYLQLDERPVEGDEVLLYCTLQTYNGEPEIQNARLIDYRKADAKDPDPEYISMSISEARGAASGSKVSVRGTVCAITYANGHIPSGFILGEHGNSIYVYGRDAAMQVSVGDDITIEAEKAYWILEDEQSNAAKFGYKGCNQLDKPTIVCKNGQNELSFDLYEFTTVKQVVERSVKEDVTSQIVGVNALIRRVEGSGFVNYYINDLDGTTGSYVYTQCNGSDFSWLDEFDGKICTVYLTPINARCESSSAFFRFLPVAVFDEGYKFNIDGVSEFAVKYYGIDQFQGSYSADPALSLTTEVSSELLGFEGARLTYSSSNTEVVYFEQKDNGEIIFHTASEGDAVVTVKAEYYGKTYSETVNIKVASAVKYDTITVTEAQECSVGDMVTVKGIVGPSLVNRDGFYLIDDGGLIAVIVNNTEIFDEISIGNEVVIKGKRDLFTKNATYGQTCISNAEVLANYYGSHEYKTDVFIKDKTLADFYALDVKKDATTSVYVLKATVEVVENKYYTTMKLVSGSTSVSLYCSSANQYSWLKAYAGKEVTLELAPCNWNSKNFYTGCVLSVILEDGTKVYNTLNFN